MASVRKMRITFYLNLCASNYFFFKGKYIHVVGF